MQGFFFVDQLAYGLVVSIPIVPANVLGGLIDKKGKRLVGKTLLPLVDGAHGSEHFCLVPKMCTKMMTEETRLRRKELRRRPKMLEWARALGLLADDPWTVVTRKRSSKKWGEE